MWRCGNDLFAYCSGEPEWKKKYLEYEGGQILAGGSCKLDPKTCGKFQTFAEQLRGMELPVSKTWEKKGGKLRRKKVDKAT